MSKKTVVGYLKLQIKGGDAKPAPPIAPLLGSKGLSQHMMAFCKEFNERTKDKLGQLIRVRITIYEDKTFDFETKTTPAAAAILQKVNISKGSPEPNRNKVGILTWAAVKEIAVSKMEDLNTTKIDSAMKMIAGTARSMGVAIKE